MQGHFLEAVVGYVEVCHGLKRTNSMGWTIYILFVRVGVDNCQKEKKQDRKSKLWKSKELCTARPPNVGKEILPCPPSRMLWAKLKSKVAYNCHIFKFTKHVVCKERLQVSAVHRKCCIIIINHNFKRRSHIFIQVLHWSSLQIK